MGPSHSMRDCSTSSLATLACMLISLVSMDGRSKMICPSSILWAEGAFKRNDCPLGWVPRYVMPKMQLVSWPACMHSPTAFGQVITMTMSITPMVGESHLIKRRFLKRFGMGMIA